VRVPPIRAKSKQKSGSLAYTGLLGWWGLLSLLLYAPRATYHNWRAINAALAKLPYDRRPPG
jgi:hypothetical protein